MRIRNMKRFLAGFVAATMVLGSSLTAFAADEGVTGTGSVEYDNSEAVFYDKVEAVVLNGNEFKFELDPTMLLNKYDPQNYGENTVFFKSDTKAKVEAKQDVKLYTKALAVKEQVSAEDKTWAGVVATLNDDGDAIATVNSGFYVWTVGTDGDGTQDNPKQYSAGLPGTAVELDGTNIGNWFELSGTASDKKIALKQDYLIETSTYKPIDGNIYYYAYTEDADGVLTDSDTDPLSDYITFKKDTDGKTDIIDTVKNLYTRSGESEPYTYANVILGTDIVYTAPESQNHEYSKEVTLINKSTREKKITAIVTAKNVGGIAFKESNTGTPFSGDKTASMWIAAKSSTAGVDDQFLTKEAATDAEATATYEVTLAGKTNGAGKPVEITYRATGTNAATGGHNYSRFEAYGPIYSNDSFKIEAAANSGKTDTDVAAAWQTWAKTVKAEERPNINIVYKVENTTKTDAEQAAEDAAAAEEAATAASAFQTKYATILAKTAETVEFEDLAAENGITAALTEFATLDSAVKTLLADDKDKLDALKTAAEAKEVVTGTLAAQKIGQKTYAVVKGAEGADLEDEKLTSIKINDVDFTAKALFYQGMYGVLVTDLTAGGISMTSGSELVATYTVDGVNYTASYTIP